MRALLFALLLIPTNSFSQAFPDRPVRLILPFGPGGLADVTFRLVAEKLTPLLGKQVLVENQPGAGGVAAANVVLKSKPDGHTLLVASNGTAISIGLFKKLPYDPIKDLAPVAIVGYFDILVLVKADSPHKNLNDLIAAVKKNPGKMNFATINPGSTQNLSGELFKSTAALDVPIIPFKTSPEAFTALIAGNVDAVFESYAAAKGLVVGGKMRALASTGTKRYGYMPELSTALEQGMQYEVTGWNALAAPAGTPPETIAILNKHVNTVTAQPDFRSRMLDFGILPYGGTPDELRQTLVRDSQKWAAVIKKAGIAQQ
jgi:tripartite-type tricarboxylate transporter receptor subunit TctC